MLHVRVRYTSGVAITQTFVLEGADKLERWFETAPDRAVKALARGLVGEGEAVIGDAKTNFVPVDQGALRASGVVLPPNFKHDGVEVTFGFGGPGKLGIVARVVHEGRRPGAKPPPVDAIRGWLRRHGIPEDMAFVVARSIGRKGTKPAKYLEQPLKARASVMGRNVGAEVAREFTR